MEENKLIAEFMGARPIVFSDGTKGHTFWNDDGEGRYGAFPDGATNYFDYDKGYHTSWDWLMPVHKKCMFTKQFIGDDQLRTLLIDAVIDADIDRLYKAVVEFIKQYNK